MSLKVFNSSVSGAAWVWVDDGSRSGYSTAVQMTVSGGAFLSRVHCNSTAGAGAIVVIPDPVVGQQGSAPAEGPLGAILRRVYG